MLLLLLILACAPPSEDTDTGGPPGCEPGRVLDELGACVPEACGTRRFAVEEADGFVDPDAPSGGDGSQERPWTELSPALERGGTVALAAGVWSGPFTLDDDHDGLRLVGRCPELSILDGSDATEDVPTLLVEASLSSELLLEGLTIQGGRWGGIVLTGGRLGLSQVHLRDNLGTGLAAGTSRARVSVDEVRVTDTQGRSDDLWGAVDMAMGADLEGTGLHLADNQPLGINAFGVGTAVAVDGCTVLDTQPHSELYGWGVLTSGGALVELQHCTLQGNHSESAVSLEAGELVLVDSEILDTQLNSEGSYGIGLDAWGGTARCERCTLRGHQAEGAGTLDGGVLELVDSVVEQTAPDALGEYGVGISLSTGSATLRGTTVRTSHLAGVVAVGAQVELSDCVLEDNGLGDGLGAGLSAVGSQVELSDTRVTGSTGEGLVFDEDSAVTLTRVEISGTRPAPDDLWQSNALVVMGGSSLVATELDLHDNEPKALTLVDPATTASITGCAITDTRAPQDLGQGVTVGPGAHLDLEDCEIRGQPRVGLAVISGSARLRRVWISDSWMSDGAMGSAAEVVLGGRLEWAEGGASGCWSGGILADGIGTELDLADVEVSEVRPGSALNIAAAVHVQLGATGTAEGISVHDSDGLGLSAVAGSSLSCTGCEVHDHLGIAAGAFGGSLHLQELDVDGVEPDPAEGLAMGLLARPYQGIPPTVVVQEASIREARTAGVWLEGPGSYTLDGLEVQGGEGLEQAPGVWVHGDGLVALDLGPGSLTLASPFLHQARGAGLLLDSATAALTGASLADNGVDLAWQRCEGLSEPALLPPGISMEWCPERHRPVLSWEVEPLLTEVMVNE